jgi:hypothetical protein
MASKQTWDVVSPVEYEAGGQKKTRWVRLGAAWERDNGGFSMQLDGVPVNGKLMIMPQKPREDRGGNRGGGHDQGGGNGPGDESIPF